MVQSLKFAFTLPLPRTSHNSSMHAPFPAVQPRVHPTDRLDRATPSLNCQAAKPTMARRFNRKPCNKVSQAFSCPNFIHRRRSESWSQHRKPSPLCVDKRECCNQLVRLRHCPAIRQDLVLLFDSESKMAWSKAMQMIRLRMACKSSAGGLQYSTAFGRSQPPARSPGS